VNNIPIGSINSIELIETYAFPVLWREIFIGAVYPSDLFVWWILTVTIFLKSLTEEIDMNFFIQYYSL
jgi:hypothetical protein